MLAVTNLPTLEPADGKRRGGRGRVCSVRDQQGGGGSAQQDIQGCQVRLTLTPEQTPTHTTLPAPIFYGESRICGSIKIQKYKIKKQKG